MDYSELCRNQSTEQSAAPGLFPGQRLCAMGGRSLTDKEFLEGMRGLTREQARLVLLMAQLMNQGVDFSQMSYEERLRYLEREVAQ